MPILSSDQYGLIRQAIDTSLTADDLPLSVISAPIYMDAAEAEVQRRDPAWASRSGAAQLALQRAVIFLTAAYLAPALPALRSEAYPEGYRYERQGVDYAARAAELRALADAEVASIVTPEEAAPLRPITFAAASGRRGR